MSFLILHVPVAFFKLSCLIWACLISSQFWAFAHISPTSWLTSPVSPPPPPASSLQTPSLSLSSVSEKVVEEALYWCLHVGKISSRRFIGILCSLPVLTEKLLNSSVSHTHCEQSHPCCACVLHKRKLGWYQWPIRFILGSAFQTVHHTSSLHHTSFHSSVCGVEWVIYSMCFSSGPPMQPPQLHAEDVEKTSHLIFSFIDWRLVQPEPSLIWGYSKCI